MKDTRVLDTRISFNIIQSLITSQINVIDIVSDLLISTYRKTGNDIQTIGFIGNWEVLAQLQVLFDRYMVAMEIDEPTEDIQIAVAEYITDNLTAKDLLMALYMMRPNIDNEPELSE